MSKVTADVYRGLFEDTKRKINPLRYRELAGTDQARTVSQLQYQIEQLMEAWVDPANNAMINEAWTRLNGAMAAVEQAKLGFYLRMKDQESKCK